MAALRLHGQPGASRWVLPSVPLLMLSLIRLLACPRPLLLWRVDVV